MYVVPLFRIVFDICALGILFFDHKSSKSRLRLHENINLQIIIKLTKGKYP